MVDRRLEQTMYDVTKNAVRSTKNGNTKRKGHTDANQTHDYSWQGKKGALGAQQKKTINNASILD